LVSVFYSNAKNSLSRGTLKCHISNGVFVVYIDTRSPVPNIPSKSCGLGDENKKLLTEWKWFETNVLVPILARAMERTKNLRRILF
jgi:hypothetical protein